MRASAARPACQLVTASATPSVAASSALAPRKMRPLRPSPRDSAGSAPIRRASGSITPLFDCVPVDCVPVVARVAPVAVPPAA